MFHIPAEPHDSWVVGDEEYVSLHFFDRTVTPSDIAGAEQPFAERN